MIAQLLQFNMEAEMVMWDRDCNDIEIADISTSENTTNIKTDSHVTIRLEV
jgi:hypothetical protein